MLIVTNLWLGIYSFSVEQNMRRIWCSGIIVPSHGTDRGSIPRMRKDYLFWQLNLRSFEQLSSTPFPGFNNRILFLWRRRVKKLKCSVRSFWPKFALLCCTPAPAWKEMEGIPRNYEFVLCWSVVCQKLLPKILTRCISAYSFFVCWALFFFWAVVRWAVASTGRVKRKDI